MFNEELYLVANPDVREAVKRGLYKSGQQHYNLHGSIEKRPGILPDDFDDEGYLALNADVFGAIESGDLASGSQHYVLFGQKEGRLYKAPTETVGLGGGVLRPDTFHYPYRAYGLLPEFIFERPVIAPEDTLVCERLIDAWNASARAAANRQHPKDEGMWSILPKRNTKLNAALADGDAAALALMLAGVFQSHIPHGIAMGRATAYVARSLPRQVSANWCDRLIRLAEALAVRPVRMPEVGDFGAPLEVDIIPTAEAIERASGAPLCFPSVGAPYGVKLKGACFPEISFSHFYAAYRINATTQGESYFEIGGGFGGLAYFMNRPGRRYTIFDLPFANLLQGYFLIKAGLDVSLCGEPEKSIRVLPWWDIEQDQKYDVAINQDSIPEMAPEIGGYYVARIKQIAKLFYSINQEGAAANGPYHHLIVPDLIKSAGGYTRKSRDLYWLRDGYVEELYAC